MALHCARQNAAECFIESFNGRLPDELFNETIFISLTHVRMPLAIWKDGLQSCQAAQCTRHLLPAVFAALSVPGMKRHGARRHLDGSAPHPVAPPSQPVSNEARTLRIGG